MNTIKSVSTCNNRKCQVKWGDGKNERAKWLAWSFTLSGHVEMTDKDLFCPEIPHFIFKPGNWLVISIQNTSCPGARWWQQSAKFSSCLHSVNWVIHGIKNSNEPWKKKIWLTEALKDIQWEQVWLFHRRGLDSAMKKKKWKRTTDNITLRDYLFAGSFWTILASLPNITALPLQDLSSSNQINVFLFSLNMV